MFVEIVIFLRSKSGDFFNFHAYSYLINIAFIDAESRGEYINKYVELYKRESLANMQKQGKESVEVDYILVDGRYYNER